MANSPGDYTGGSSSSSTSTGDPFSGSSISAQTPIYSPTTKKLTSKDINKIEISTNQALPLVAGQTVHSPTQSAQQLLDQLYSMPDIGAFQKRLLAGGYLSSTTDITGVVDQNTLQAYENLLIDTYGYNVEHIKITPEQVLQRAIGSLNAQGNGPNGSGAAPVQLMGASDAQGNLESASGNLLGAGAVSSSDVAGYQGEVNSALQDASKSHTSVDPTEMAKQYLLQQHPQEAAQHSALNYYDIAMQLIGGGA